MARFRLSTDILSPIHSDISSSNDTSRFSFGSLPSTPAHEKDTAASRNKDFKKNSSSSSGIMKEAAAQLDVIINDFHTASNINAEKEERFKESYDILSRSMDEVLYKKTFNSSILSPISKDIEEENIISPSESSCAKINTAKLAKNSNVNLSKMDKNHESKTVKISSKKIEEVKKERPASLRQKNNSNGENSTCTSKVSVDKKSKSKSLDSDKTTRAHEKPKVAASSVKTAEVKEHPSKTIKVKSESKPKEQRTVKDFKFKTQQKICVPEHSKPLTENKGLSIEKTIQVAVGLQMDNIRNFILDQNLSMRKELLKVQESFKEKTDVTGYLFSVIDELIETNKKLITKHK